MNYSISFKYASATKIQKVESITLPYEGDLKVKVYSDNLLCSMQIKER